MVVLFCCHLQLSATTIVPFPNLSEMAMASEAVVLVEAINNYEYQQGTMTRFRTQLKVLNNVKGPLQVGDLFSIQNLHLRMGEVERTVWGDLELEAGHKYFLFLDFNPSGYWQPKMLSYAAFEEMEWDNQKVLVPLGLSQEVHILPSSNGEAAEPMKIYKETALLDRLSEVLNHAGDWSQREIITNLPLDYFADAVARDGVNPGHCTHLSGTPTARWRDFDTDDLPVYYAQGGDSGCATAATKIQGAITDMNNQYTGINLSDGGTHAFVPTCNMQGATDGEFTSWVGSNLGSRSLVIQFDDPCSEIADLSGCNGTLAIGGLYWSSATHSWCGQDWQTALYGYVIVNNGTGACQCGSTDYDVMITHEMTHSLNVGHISGSNTANMNPNCCTAIQQLDIDCLDYMYLEPAPLPVELSGFNGRQVAARVELTWQTASETKNDFFTIERSVDGYQFEEIGKVSGQGDAHHEQNYDFWDNSPRQGTNYYRLIQTDLDGTRTILEKIITIDYEGEEGLLIQPNPVQGAQAQLIFETHQNGPLQLNIFNTAGQVIQSMQLSAAAARNVYDLDLGRLSTGVYIIEATQNATTKSMRFVKTK